MTTASVAFAVQKAVDGVLLPVLAALTPSTPLYDDVPANRAFPYVQFGRVMATPDNLVARKMTRVQLALTVFSDFRGQEQVLEILGAIEAALDDARLTLDLGTAVRCDLDRHDTVRDSDGETYTGTALYTILVEH